MIRALLICGHDWDRLTVPRSGVRQHALLNLIRMHYVRNEFVAARKVSGRHTCRRVA